MIYADPPRKYKRRGQSWSHVCSPDLRELEAYAKEHGLKRKDGFPWIHFDVTKEELSTLPGISVIGRRELLKIMHPYRRLRKIRTRGCNGETDRSTGIETGPDDSRGR